MFRRLLKLFRGFLDRRRRGSFWDFARHLSRYDGEGDPRPLQWKPCHPSTISRFKAEVTCANGHGLTLKNHAVAADGRVYPSIVCLAPSCSYHEIVILDGWDFGDLAA